MYLLLISIIWIANTINQTPILFGIQHKIPIIPVEIKQNRAIQDKSIVIDKIYPQNKQKYKDLKVKSLDTDAKENKQGYEKKNDKKVSLQNDGKIFFKQAHIIQNIYRALPQIRDYSIAKNMFIKNSGLKYSSDFFVKALQKLNAQSIGMKNIQQNSQDKPKKYIEWKVKDKKYPVGDIADYVNRKEPGFKIQSGHLRENNIQHLNKLQEQKTSEQKLILKQSESKILKQMNLDQNLKKQQTNNINQKQKIRQDRNQKQKNDNFGKIKKSQSDPNHKQIIEHSFTMIQKPIEQQFENKFYFSFLFYFFFFSALFFLIFVLIRRYYCLKQKNSYQPALSEQQGINMFDQNDYQI